MGIVLGINHSSLPGAVAEIEQLRHDAANVSPATAEDVIGQVTAWNQKIVSYQRYNQIWWSGWAIPDGWDDIKTIPVPVALSAPRNTRLPEPVSQRRVLLLYLEIRIYPQQHSNILENVGMLWLKA